MTATQVNLIERGENVVIFKKKKSLHLESVSDFLIFVFKIECSLKKKSLHLESDSNFLHFCLKYVMTPPERSSLLKSSADRFFLLRAIISKPLRPIRIALATHSLRNTVLKLFYIGAYIHLLD